MIVVDASSLAKYILREEGWESVKTYLSKELCSLDLALLEVSNAIWKHHILHAKISLNEALFMFNALEKLKDVLIFESPASYLAEAEKIAINERISVYDAAYLSQAKKYGFILTSDKKQSGIAKNMRVSVEYVA